MRAGANSVMADARARTDWTDMGPGIRSMTADARTHADNRAGMRPGIDAMTIDTGACADRTDMGPGTDAVAADMRPDTDSQNLNASAHVRQGCGWSKQGERKQADRDGFHRVNSSGGSRL